MSTVRQFIRFCESVDAVRRGVAEKIVLPDGERKAWTETLDEDEADAILVHLRKYYYGSR